MRTVPLRSIATITWIIAALVVLASAQPGLAHASLVKSTPADGAKLSKAPSEVRAWFSEKLKFTVGTTATAPAPMTMSHAPAGAYAAGVFR